MKSSVYTARMLQIARLSSALSCHFGISTLVTLRFPNVARSEKDKKNDLRALIVRAKVRAGDSLKYIIVPEFSQSSADIIAYHIITDMPSNMCEDVCKRWYRDHFKISTVDARRPEMLPSFMFDPAYLKAGRHHFSTSHNLLTAQDAAAPVSTPNTPSHMAVPMSGLALPATP